MAGSTARRTGAFFIMVALLASIAMIGAPRASAHHPEVAASSRCDGYDPVIDYQVSSWSTGAQGSNANVGVYVDGVWKASGEFTSANGYGFVGTLPAADLVGRTVTVMARADGPWGNGYAAGDWRSVRVAVTADCGGTTTTTEATTTTTQATTTTTQATTTTTQPTTTTTQVQPVTVAVTVGECVYVDGVSVTDVFVEITPDGAAAVTIRTEGGPIVMDRSGTVSLTAGTYNWNASAVQGFELTGKTYGRISARDCTPVQKVSVAVSVGECVYDIETGSSTAVRVKVDEGAVVTIDGPGGQVVVDATKTVTLTPGDYTWTASAADGYVLEGYDRGSFKIRDCSPTCTALIGDYVWLDLSPRNGIQDEGEAVVEGVVVHLLDADGNVLATTMTDGNGHYEFADLCAGTYRVKFDLPDIPGLTNEAWTIAKADGPELDSNADPNGLTDLIVVVDGTADNSWDAGIVGDAVSPTTIVNTTTTTQAATTSTSVVVTSSTTVPPVTGSTLPFTGSELQGTAMVGILALIGGLGLLFGLRRRPQDEATDTLGAW